MSKLWGFCSFFLSSILFAQSVTPLGYWKTIDDVTAKPKAIVEISETAEHQLVGKIVKLFHDPQKRCVACKEELHNQPILGMQILKNLKINTENPKLFESGQILDPKNGKNYHCMIRVSENNQELFVRGYIGVPLFGRSQTWLRVSDWS